MKDTTTTFCIDINLSEFAATVTSGTSREDLKEFILAIDEHICDYDFTLELAKALVAVLKEEHIGEIKPFNMKVLED